MTISETTPSTSTLAGDFQASVGLLDGPPVPPATITGTLAQNVRFLRLERGWSQEELASICGWAQARISEVEAGGQDRRLGTVQKLADAFGVTAESLLRSPMAEKPKSGGRKRGREQSQEVAVETEAAGIA